ncbi:tetratricopeptide repeat protein [Cytophagaceae bacterium ABcell3]|nr:tetratricopeptide repeat protein [Cytophagaceae bacterium ABcell3]
MKNLVIIILILFTSCINSDNKKYYKLGLYHFNNKDYLNALVFFKKVDSVYEHCNRNAFLGASYQNLGNYKNAIIHFESAKTNCDPNVELLINLSDSYYKDEKFDSAVSVGLLAYKKDPNLFQSCFNLGLFYYDLEEYDYAYHYLKKAELLNSEDNDVYDLLATVYSAAGEYDSSLIYINKAIKIDKRLEYFVERSTYYAMLKDFDSCINDLNYVISIDSMNEAAYYNRSHALYKIGKTEEACKDFTVAKKINPNSDLEKWVKCY